MNEKQIEATARELCKIRGIDPDKRVIHCSDPDETGFACDVCLILPTWTLVAREVRSHYECTQAINASKQGQQEDQGPEYSDGPEFSGWQTRVGPEQQESTRQYFYKVTDCPTLDSKSPDCICWHDEGTGPIAQNPEWVKSWRAKRGVN